MFAGGIRREAMSDAPRHDALKRAAASSITWSEEYEFIERELAAMTVERDAWKLAHHAKERDCEKLHIRLGDSEAECAELRSEISKWEQTVNAALKDKYYSSCCE
jgi:chromosome segregation ATPase